MAQHRLELTFLVETTPEQDEELGLETDPFEFPVKLWKLIHQSGMAPDDIQWHRIQPKRAKR